MDVVAKLRQHGKKDQPLKLLCNTKMALTLPIFCFLENAKKLGQSDDATWRKKRGWPNSLSF